MRILLADDRVSVRSALRLLLELEPNVEVVGEVGNCGALCELTATLRPDLILLDWGLREARTTRGGRQLITTLRTIQPQVYIIALSSPQDTGGYPLAAGADAFVSKAEPPTQLLAAIRRAEALYRQTQFSAIQIEKEVS